MRYIQEWKITELSGPDVSGFADPDYPDLLCVGFVEQAPSSKRDVDSYCYFRGNAALGEECPRSLHSWLHRLSQITCGPGFLLSERVIGKAVA